jgi:hypothetical protein
MYCVLPTTMESGQGTDSTCEGKTTAHRLRLLDHEAGFAPLSFPSYLTACSRLVTLEEREQCSRLCIVLWQAR